MSDPVPNQFQAMMFDEYTKLLELKEGKARKFLDNNFLPDGIESASENQSNNLHGKFPSRQEFDDGLLLGKSEGYGSSEDVRSVLRMFRNKEPELFEMVVDRITKIREILADVSLAVFHSDVNRSDLIEANSITLQEIYKKGPLPSLQEYRNGLFNYILNKYLLGYCSELGIDEEELKS